MLTDRDTAYRLEQSHQCADCGPRYALVTRWNGSRNSLEVVCGQCHGERFARRKSVTQQWRDDPDSVPVHVANRLADKHGGEKMSDQALAVISKQEMTARIAGARWMHQLTPEQQATLADIAVRYGYDPLMGEVTVYEGKIYVTVDGALRDAKRVPHFQGILTIPLTQQEREARGIKQPIAYKCELYRADWRVPAIGIGVADPANPMRNNPVERQQPHTLAEARAIRRAVRLAREAPSGLIREDIDLETGEVLAQQDAPALPVNSAARTDANESTAREMPAPEPPEPPLELAWRKRLEDAANLPMLAAHWREVQRALTAKQLDAAQFRQLGDVKDARKVMIEAALAAEPIAAPRQEGV